jgi:hypothetical protein
MQYLTEGILRQSNHKKAPLHRLIRAARAMRAGECPEANPPTLELLRQNLLAISPVPAEIEARRGFRNFIVRA